MLEQQLRQRAADAPEVDPTASLADVVRRGRIRLAASRLAGGLAVAAVVTAGIVTVPLMLEDPMPTPEVLDVDPVEDVVEQGGNHEGKGETETGGLDLTSSEQPQHGPLALVFDVDVLILYPEPGFETDAKEVLVEGVVESGAQVWVSGVPALVDGDTFQVVVPLEPGAQELRAFARLGGDRAGVDEIPVVRHVAEDGSSEPGKQPVDEEKDPHEDDKPHEKPEPDGTEFTAVQARSHDEGDPPIGVYEGTAPAGSWVKIWSKYGWSKQQVGSSGEWRIEVAFHEAPAGIHTWPVEAWLLETGAKRFFEFTGTRPEGEAGGEFTAVQVRSHDEGDPPVGVYEGTAPAGSWVKVWSEYGWSKQQVAGSGEWRIEAAFHDAPAGTHTWAVEVRLLDTGQKEFFEFTGTRPEGETVAFTANQLWGESDEDPPTDVFWGTAHPGTKVKVHSQYGSGYTMALENGDWELEVTFEHAPVGESFPVEVRSDHTGESVWFDFERLS